MARLGDRLREIANQASTRTGLLFVLAFVLLVAWIVLAALGVGN